VRGWEGVRAIPGCQSRCLGARAVSTWSRLQRLQILNEIRLLLRA
jgi:hypothetical protein